jgi:hypothetical protein
MPLSADLAEKSVQAAIAAIEIYNKPNFSYREEAFSLLMTNAWELLLKAKWLVDHSEVVESLYEIVKDDPAGPQHPKVNGSGNPISHGLVYLAARMMEDKNSGLEPASNENILALVEIRNNAAHLINKDLYIGRRVQEIGTACLRNYLMLATEWFGSDLSVYNFFLMPISFYHGFEAAEPASRDAYPEQIQRLLSYIDAREATEADGDGNQHVALHLETRLVKGKDAAALEFRYTDDPKAPAIAVREQDVFKNYPMTYRDLSDTMKRRYSNFLENRDYHRLRKTLEREQKFCILRLLNPSKPESTKQRFYNANIFHEFDKHYARRKK